jgi:hypothetical protein
VSRFFGPSRFRCPRRSKRGNIWRPGKWMAHCKHHMFRRPPSRLKSAISLGRPRLAGSMESATKGRDHSLPFLFSAWRRYHVRRDISSLSQGFWLRWLGRGPRSEDGPCEGASLSRRAWLAHRFSVDGSGQVSACARPADESFASTFGDEVRRNYAVVVDAVSCIGSGAFEID